MPLDNARRQVKGYVERYNNVRLNSTVAYIAPRTCSPGDSRRYMPGGIGRWRRRENSGRFVSSRLREERKGQSPVTRELAGRRACKHYAFTRDLSAWPVLIYELPIRLLVSP